MPTPESQAKKEETRERNQKLERNAKHKAKVKAKTMRRKAFHNAAKYTKEYADKDDGTHVTGTDQQPEPGSETALCRGEQRGGPARRYAHGEAASQRVPHGASPADATGAAH